MQLSHNAGFQAIRTSFLIAVCLILSLATASRAYGLQDMTADLVLGQPDFTSRTPVLPPTSSSLYYPEGVHVDLANGRLYATDFVNARVVGFSDMTGLSNGQAADLVITTTEDIGYLFGPAAVTTDSAGTLYIADLHGNRVLVYNAPVTTTGAADWVIGQPNMSGLNPNQHPPLTLPSERTLSGPAGLAVSGNRLFVADMNNNRVLGYTLPITENNKAADIVIGQIDFTQVLTNAGDIATSAYGLHGPQGLAVDSAGDLFVADTKNHRVLRFPSHVIGSTKPPAATVLGQPNLTSGAANQGRLEPGADTLDNPVGLLIHPAGHLFVADTNNLRVLGYQRPLFSGKQANMVVGQPDFGPPQYGWTNPPTDKSLAFPHGVTTDDQWNLIVSDHFNNRVLVYHGPFWNSMSLPMLRKP